MVFDRSYHVVFMRKENYRTYFEEEEGSIIFSRSSMRRMNYMLSLATYISLPRSAGTLWPLAQPPKILAAPRHQFSHHPSVGSTLRAPQHRGPRIIPYPHRPDEEAYKDIPDDVLPQHEDPPTQPPPPSRLVHAVASYANISERLTRFEQQCFQRFDNIDATLQ
ncbi:hypothetical protein GOBAR_AA17008 [Gossypium barbadense]|uniref:Uncharacterized protein n=1 Tax=Gossypium barbadense TaxID=3634 RepID=A0A2P5XJY1_GOSBA|nr:hypothetical protein GOBAR_AA17008 [Gossypium barbadense]